MRTHAFLPAALLAVTIGAHAQAVEVSYAPHGHFTDAGETPHDVARTEAELTAHLQSLGQRLLPAGSKLKVVVTEIDLAGEIPHRLRSPRVLTGQADRPLLELRYEFTRADGQVEPGEATLSDLTYLDRRLPSTTGTVLPYEKRLIEDWLRQRFGSGTTPG
jgi:hypothetical protein